MPATPDARNAFLLLDCIPPRDFIYPISAALFRLKFATLLGFFGMLRFSSLLLLKPAAIVLVAASGRQVLLTAIPITAARSLCRHYIGFFFRFRCKSTPVGGPPQAAYFPKILDIAPSFTPFCPLVLLSQMHSCGLFRQPRQFVFPPASFTPKTLCPYLMFLAGGGRPPCRHPPT